MFKKLVTNLPFNPSLINQVGFYADRLRKEKSIRRLSFVFMALAMAIQSLAVISPPERSLAASTNHIQNGVRTKQDILRGYDSNTSGLKDIYTRFNISRADIAALTNTPNVTVRTNDGNDWWTTGRTSLWGYAKVNSVYKNNEKPIVYKSDGSKIYARQLRAWDIRNPYNSYRAFKGVSQANGRPFYVLVDCGNISWPGLPPSAPEPKKPELQIQKSIVGNPASLKPGDTFTYRIEYRNKVIGSVAKDVVIRDQLDLKNFDIVSPKNLTVSSSGLLQQKVSDLNGSSSFSKLDITVKLKNSLPKQVCNVSSLQSSNATTVQSNNKCINIIVPCPYDPNVPNINDPNCAEPVVVCQLLDTVVNRTTKNVTFKTVITSSNPATTTVKNYNYDFGDGTKQKIVTSELTNTTSHTYALGDFTANVVATYRTTGQDQKTDKTVDCSREVSFDDKALTESKSVKNITRGLENDEAIKTTVKAGDVLEYTLTTINTQNYDRDDITVVDYIGDILDYATLDPESISASGGVFDEVQSKITWSKLKVPANSQIVLTFRVQMLDPIPATNSPSATSGDFDCTIDNTYGNLVSMSVQCPVVKGIETIPNTGPGTSLLAVVGITSVVGYFFARARLFSKELTIIRTDFATTGGM